MHSFVQDYINAGGICDFGLYATTGPPNYDPLYPTTEQCEGILIYEYEYYSEQFMDVFEFNTTEITTGVCSEETVAKLNTRECQRELASQPNFIYSTLNIIMYDMCRPDELPAPIEGFRKVRKQFTDKRKVSRNSTDRIPPIGLVLEDLSDGLLFIDLKPGKLNYTWQSRNTKS